MRLFLAAIYILFITTLPSVGQKPHEAASSKNADAQHAQKDTTIAVNLEPTKQGQEQTKAQSSKRPPFWDIYWPTLFLVGLGVVGAFVGIITLSFIKRQIQAAINTERAWVAVEFIGVCSQGKDGRWYDRNHAPINVEDALRGKHLLYVLRLTNFGRTPAHILNFRVLYSVVPENHLPENSEEKLIASGDFDYMLTDGSVEITDPIVDVGATMQDSRAKIDIFERAAVFHGKVTYQHMFSARRMFGGKEQCRADCYYAFAVNANRLVKVAKYSRYT